MSFFSGGASSSSVDSFEAFLNRCLAEEHALLDELIKAQATLNLYESTHEAEIKDLITRTMALFQEYYQEKSRMIRRDVFTVLSPTWLSPSEKPSLWIAGFRPIEAIYLLFRTELQITLEQFFKLSRLMEETQVEQSLLGLNLRNIQQSLAVPPVVQLAKCEGKRQLVEGETTHAEAVPIRLRTEMENLVFHADSLRIKVLQEILEILNPMQKPRFLAAAINAHLTNSDAWML